MMKKLIFFLEEASMREMLDILLPRVLPQNVGFQLIAHKGKQHLEKAIPYKLRRWQAAHVHFVIMRDQNSDDCVKLIQRLKKLCQQAGEPEALVRIVCHWRHGF
jgi:hypothetical protein